MSHKRKSGAGVGVAMCDRCNLIHLIITENNEVALSMPLTREEWSFLIGAYGDLLSRLGNERTH